MTATAASEQDVYLDAFAVWLAGVAEDAVGLSSLLLVEAMPEAARRSIAGALTYLFKSLDLVPDGINDIGYLDDAFVFRIAARNALHVPGTRAAHDGDLLRRLAGDVDLVSGFLGAEFPRLDAYVRGTEHAAARGRTVDELMGSAEVSKEFVADVASFAKAYNAPPFARDHKTLVKLRAFLHSRLPPA